MDKRLMNCPIGLWLRRSQLNFSIGLGAYRIPFQEMKLEMGRLWAPISPAHDCDSVGVRCSGPAGRGGDTSFKESMSQMAPVCQPRCLPPQILVLDSLPQLRVSGPRIDVGSL